MASGGQASGVSQIQLLPAWHCRSADWTLASQKDALLLHRIEAIGVGLSDLGISVRLGACTGADEIFLVDGPPTEPAGGTGCVQAACDGDICVELAALRPILRGRNVRAWHEPCPTTYCICPYDSTGRLLPERTFKRVYPLAYRHLLKHGDILRERSLADAQPWYSFRRRCLAPMLEAPKLVAGSIGSSTFTLDTAGVLCHNSVVMINSRPAGIDPFFLLGVLNSQLFSTYVRYRAPTVRFGGHALRIHMLRGFPLAMPHGKDRTDLGNQIARRSRELLPKRAAQRSPQIADPVLDQLVWRLYGIAVSSGIRHYDHASGAHVL